MQLAGWIIGRARQATGRAASRNEIQSCELSTGAAASSAAGWSNGNGGGGGGSGDKDECGTLSRDFLVWEAGADNFRRRGGLSHSAAREQSAQTEVSKLGLIMNEG